ncbi:MAG TPA: cupredoxin domain-containing protein [Solirubrobacteraceae bacterium]|nr:cupredoxin domain-containing protein [Solirubrobacteraceae bacterium]
MAVLVLAALAVVLPAVAGSETSPSITAVNGTGIYAEQTHSWSPSQVTVGEGASVTLSNPTTVRHGVRWVSSPATPVCSAGVPVGTSEAASGAEWNGACTFTQPGSYVFYCTVHGAAMSGTITVGALTPGSPPISTPPTTPPVGPTLAGGEGSGGQPGAGTAPELGDASPFTGGVGALRLASRQRGASVRGAVNVSAAGARGRLEVELLAKGASLAGAGRGDSREVRLGSLERGSLSAGIVRFAVALGARGKRVLKRRGRLALTVELALTPPGGHAAKLQRGVVLRPAP